MQYWMTYHPALHWRPGFSFPQTGGSYHRSVELPHDSDALRSYDERLMAYLDGQGSQVEALRSRSQPSEPWPEADNPMLSYLIDRTTELLAAEGAETAVVWLAVHAWFEGTFDERARMLRKLGS